MQNDRGGHRCVQRHRRGDRPPARRRGFPRRRGRPPRRPARRRWSRRSAGHRGELRRHLGRVGGRPGRGGDRAAAAGARCWSTTPAAPAGLDPVSSGSVDDWQWMYDVNVLGTLRVTKALLPALEASGAGTIVTVGSTAGLHAVRGRRRLHGGQARADRPGRHAAAGDRRQAGPGDRDRPGHGADRRVLAQPLRRRRRPRPTRSTRGSPSRWSPTTSPTASRWRATRPAARQHRPLVVRPIAQAAQHKVHREE